MENFKIFAVSVLYLTLLANAIGGLFSAIYNSNYEDLILWIPFILPILLFESAVLASIYFVYKIVIRTSPNIGVFYNGMIILLLLLIIMLILESLGSKGVNLKESIAGFIQLLCGLIIFFKYTLPKWNR